MTFIQIDKFIKGSNTLAFLYAYLTIIWLYNSTKSTNNMSRNRVAVV